MRKAAQSKGRRGAGGPGGPTAPTGPRPKRFLDYPRWGKVGFRRWVPSIKQVLSGGLIVFGSMVGLIGIAYASTSVPSVNPSTTQQNNVFYYADGHTVLATTGTVNRQNVKLQDVPVQVQHDFMAAEDETFEKNSGVDPTSILRAVKNMVTGGQIQSGSTITQQWVKNSILSDTNQTVQRKFSEIMISIKIGNGYYSKDKVLEGYLNSNYYGRGANGIEAAAEAYYKVHASQLTVSQGAFITATVNEPSFYQNIDTSAAVKAQAVARWTYVLNRMVANNWMTAAERAQYTPDKFPTPLPWAQNATLAGQTGYLVQTAQNYVETHSTPKITDADFAKGGFQIVTTFVKKDVDTMSASVAKMEKDNLDPAKRSADNYVQTGSASVDPRSGQVLALYGGPGVDKGHFDNNANSSGVPVGSTFKPIVMAAALENGAVLKPGAARSPITPSSKFNGDDAITIRNQEGTLLTDPKDKTGLLHQKNDDTAMPGFITLATAMDDSVNTPYVQLGEDVGYDEVETMAIKLGLSRSILTHDTAGFYIGTSTPSAIRMASVYATFADGGIYHDPYTVTKLTRNGALTQPVLTRPTSTVAMSANTANVINGMLQNVIKQGTATTVKSIDRPAAGKTGTTDEYKSAWFIGYTPQLSTAVAMFREDPKSATLLSMQGTGGAAKFFGDSLPATVWLDFMLPALDGVPPSAFPPVPNLGPGTNEPGAPTPTPSAPASPTASNSPSVSSSPSISLSPTPTSNQPSNPTPTSTCKFALFGCQQSAPPTGGPGNSGSATPSSGAPTNPNPTTGKPGRPGNQ